MDQLPPPPSDAPKELPAEPTPPRGGRRWLVVAVVVFLAIGVAVAVALGGGSDTPPAAVASASPSPSELLQPNPPANLKASAGAFNVKLTWRPGTGDGAPVDHYDIMRGTTIVGHADGDATSFVDDTALPKQEFDYQVIAVSADGARLGATVRAKTSSAPAGTATLTGVFNVKVHPTSHSGFSSFTEKDFTAGWRFVPSCKQPPCDTQLRDLGSKDFLIHLKRSGGLLRGIGVRVGSGVVQRTRFDEQRHGDDPRHPGRHGAGGLADHEVHRDDVRVHVPAARMHVRERALRRDRFAGEGVTPARLQRMEPTGKLHASRKASSFTESVIREMTRLAHVHDAINLGQGFPDFPAPAIVKEAAAKAIAEDHNQYPITWGVPVFRRAIAATYARDYGMTVDPETEICVTCGATEAMAATFLGVLDPGDEVVVFEPFYESYGPGLRSWPARRCGT